MFGCGAKWAERPLHSERRRKESTKAEGSIMIIKSPSNSFDFLTGL
jgi:hypothetical protein